MDLGDAKSLWAADVPTADPSDPNSTTDMNSPSLSSRTLSDAELMRLVQEKSRTFDKRIWWRDVRESLAALVILVGFGWIAWTTSGLAQLGALVIMGCGVYIPWHLYKTRARHAQVPTDGAVVERLRAEQAKVDAQIDLIQSIAVWYLAPLGVGALLLIVGADGWTWSSLGQAVVVVGAGIGAYLLNQRAVRNDLRPRRDELTNLIEGAES